MLARLSADLTAAQRKDILKDVELAKQHVIAVFTLKLSHWMIPPHVVMGMAHYDDDKMWECYTKARDSGHDHPRIKRLLSDDLAADVVQFSEHRSCLFYSPHYVQTYLLTVNIIVCLILSLLTYLLEVH